MWHIPKADIDALQRDYDRRSPDDDPDYYDEEEKAELRRTEMTLRNIKKSKIDHDD